MLGVSQSANPLVGEVDRSLVLTEDLDFDTWDSGPGHDLFGGVDHRIPAAAPRLSGRTCPTTSRSPR